MAESVVSFAVNRISGLLTEETKFLGAVKGQVEDLQKELTRIRCFLKDADAKQERNELVRDCVSEIREIAYDAEDVIETYVLKVALEKTRDKPTIFKVLVRYLRKCVCVEIHKVGTEIEDINSNLSNLRTSLRDYGIQPVKESGSSSSQDERQMSRRTYAHVEEDLVGMGDSISEIVGILKEGNERVVSICGMGGLGKTTLAKKVFTHSEVRNSFDAFVWVCVSQQYEVKDILVGILTKLVPDQRKEISEMRDEDLFERLYQIQGEKRSLVVLDDVWTTEAWNCLKDAFPTGKTVSKLLVTTRNREIAEHMDPHGSVHVPPFLSKRESWELLKKKAIRTNELTISSEMESLGKEMLERCGGLPLAIVLLGGLLATKKSLMEWETVHQNFNLEFGKGKSEVTKVLALSYNDLPYHLKPCFLHLSYFPEDAEIRASKIVHMWIAEGFVSSSVCGGMEEVIAVDVAKHYLSELVNRGMVQAQVDKSIGNIKTCRLHDLMREFCISKAKEENFLHVHSHQNIDASEDLSSFLASQCKIRRLAMYLGTTNHGNMLSVKLEQEKMHHLRTLLLFTPKGSKARELEHLQPIFVNYKLLRVLDLQGYLAKDGVLPVSIGDLVHLRYLSLWWIRVKELPPSIGNLLWLETLDLRLRSEVLLPNVLWKMKRLRHLYLPFCFSISKGEKLKLSSLETLEILKNFSLVKCELTDLKKLINLRKLTVRPQSVLEGLKVISELASFGFRHLRSSSYEIKGRFRESDLNGLSSYKYPCKLWLNGSIAKLPEHVCFPPHLTKLVLNGSGLDEDPLEKLEKLPNLIILHLFENAFVGKEMSCSPGGFPQLRGLLLRYLTNLEEWRVAKGAMPNLRQSEIFRCFGMEQMPVPEGLSFIASLESIDAGRIGLEFRVVKKEHRWEYYRV